MKNRRLAVGLLAVSTTAAVVALTGPTSFAGSHHATTHVKRLGHITAMYDTGVSPPPAATFARAGIGLQSWTRTVNDGGSFTYRMVGKSPFVQQANPVTTVKTALVPLIINFPDAKVWDPTVGDSCDATSAVTRTLNSPIVQARKWKFGGTSVGKGQFTDAFQRANFFSRTKASGLNPGYHVNLNYQLQPAITVDVPGTAAAEGTLACGNGTLGAIEINWLDSYIQTVLLPQLKSQGFGKKTFPLFLVQNVVEYMGTPANCCVLGFHSATSTAPSAQTYSVSMYDNTSAFVGSADVSVLSHEVAEWMDDPFVNNATNPWGNIGQVSGCQANLETGDPLTGTVQNVSMNGKAYHVQENAFASWFYHQIPSLSVNGWYSNLGTFTTPAAPCP